MLVGVYYYSYTLMEDFFFFLSVLTILEDSNMSILFEYAYSIVILIRKPAILNVKQEKKILILEYFWS